MSASENITDEETGKGRELGELCWFLVDEEVFVLAAEDKGCGSARVRSAECE